MAIDYQNYRYFLDDDTTSASIKLNQYSAGVQTSITTGTTTLALHAKISRGNKEYGLRPRYVVLTRSIGTGDATKSLYSKLAFVRLSQWQGVSIGDTFTINSILWTVLSKAGESLR